LPRALKFLADECFSFLITAILREMEYDVLWVGEINSGADDTEVFEISRKDGRIILTEDKDFGELAIRFGHKAKGIIQLRIEPEKIELRKKMILKLFRDFPEKLEGHLITIDDEKFRFRRL
jgi:predicted nuclease of predicted toxin-antitoxin system